LKNPDDANTLTSFIKNQFLLPVQTAAVAGGRGGHITFDGDCPAWIKNTSGSDIFD